MNVTRYLNRADASQYLRETYGAKISKNRLNRLAVDGGGPRFYRIGLAAVYTREDLDAWAKQRMQGPFESTSERAA